LAIVAESFRLVTARLIPRRIRCKQALLLATLILSGCGGSGAPKAAAWQTVRAVTFHFQAPAGWTVTRSKGRTTAKDGSSFVQVATFPLVRAYDPSLFARVRAELDERMTTVAEQTSGSVSGHRTVTVDGVRSHSYDVDAAGRTATYTFVLRGKREVQLLCSARAEVCARLLTSFGAD
jgi:hypothetical protein